MKIVNAHPSAFACASIGLPARQRKLRPSQWLSLVLSMVFLTASLAAEAATVWNGPKVVFSKANGASPTQAANQDRLTANVWLTRGSSQGIYNAARESTFTRFASPADTEWATGTTANYQTLSYTDWDSWAGSLGKPPATVGVNAVLHLKTDDIYVDIKFLSWSQTPPSGDGFSYERSSAGTVAPPTCTLSANPSSISAGGSATLSASCSPTATSYSWSANTGFGSSIAIGTVTPAASTTYSVSGINAGGAGNTASVTVNVAAAVPPPTCSLSATPASISVSGSSTLLASCSPTPTSYTWSGGTCAGTNAASCTVSPASTTSYSVTGTGVGGTGNTASVTVSVATAVAVGPYSGLWWNANESGWGMSVTQHGNISFIAVFTYDQAGLPTWYVISNCPLSGNSCSGDLYRVSGGTPPSVAWNGSAKVVTRVGSGTLSFTDTDNGRFAFDINGVAGAKTITRQPIAAGAVPTVDYTDLWWNPDESGWGIALTQQSNTIFAAWYAYNAQGNAIWYVASNCAVAGSVCSGSLYRVAGGSPPTVAWNGANLAVSAVGTININFADSANAVMNYSIDGVAGRRNITRQPF